MTKIVQMGNKMLRKKAEEIDLGDITSPKIQKIIVTMNEALATQNDGVAIAAPQIGSSLRIFTVSPIVFEESGNHPLVYINPVITQRSEKTKWLHEGCLSCRWKVGEVERSLSVTIEAYDEHGNLFTESADGLLAHIFQHETDHLDGVLFIDKARKLRDMTDEEINELLLNG